MNNHSNHDASKEYKSLKSQQYDMDDTRRRRRGSEREDQPRMTPPPSMTPPPPSMAPEAPGMGQAPRTAPPNFIPEGPGMGRGQMGGPGMPGFPGPGMPGPGMPGPGMPGPGRRGPSTIFVPTPGQPQEFFEFGGTEFRVSPRDIRRCLNHFTFIWLINGNSFWFYPTFVGRQFVQGFRWRRDHWEFDSINLRRIFFFRCF